MLSRTEAFPVLQSNAPREQAGNLYIGRAHQVQDLYGRPMAIMRRSGSENDNSSSSERHQQDEAQCQPRERAHQLRQRCKEGGMRFHLGGWCDGRDGVTQRSHMTGRSEEHTYEHQSLMRISSAVFCFTKKQRK